VSNVKLLLRETVDELRQLQILMRSNTGDYQEKYDFLIRRKKRLHEHYLQEEQRAAMIRRSEQ
jgi:uncharacterized protein (UPF0305 family)